MRGFWSRSLRVSMPRRCWAIPSAPLAPAASLRLARLVRAPRGARAGLAPGRTARILEPRFRAVARHARSPARQRDPGRRGAGASARSAGGRAHPRPWHGHGVPVAGAPGRIAEGDRLRHRRRARGGGRGARQCRIYRLGIAGLFCRRRVGGGAGRGFDVVVANPPYIPTGDLGGLRAEVARYDPALALDGGADGLLAYRETCARASASVKAVRLCLHRGGCRPGRKRRRRFLLPAGP